jgi:hypothetical protein
VNAAATIAARLSAAGRLPICGARNAEMKTSASAPIATGEGALARSPDCPGLISKQVLAYLQLCDLRATEVGWFGVRDDLTKTETDHSPASGDSSVESNPLTPGIVPRLGTAMSSIAKGRVLCTCAAASRTRICRCAQWPGFFDVR